MTLLVLLLFSLLLLAHPGDAKSPNVLLILADDLGFGDLGFKPFTSPEMANLRTPHLENMQKNGLTMTNFHSAAPMCSPARASILVGLFPWRLGVDYIYSQDLKRDGSQEMDHEQLPLLPNIAMMMRETGYYTAHVGKWHLGGITQVDIKARANHSQGPCFVPGINQYGFDEYVAMTEGQDGRRSGLHGSCAACSARARTHDAGNTYSTGARYLVRNDVPIPRRQRDEVLTDRQTEEAMRVISEQTRANRPFFVNLWYDAPHSPWEAIEPFYSQFEGKFPAQTLLQKYASMVANMDMNIGRLLQHLETLGIAQDTIVIFTSDNGPESGAGFTAGLKGRKRLLTEGGIRVPCLWQWKGRIPSGITINKFALSTDIFPTLLHVIRAKLPSPHRLDGFSLLPLLLQSNSKGLLSGNKLAALDNAFVVTGDERVALWYAHAPDHPKLTAAWAFGFKLLWNDYEGRKADRLPPPFRLYDVRLDGKEEHDLLPGLLSAACGAVGQLGVLEPTSWLNVSRIDRHQLASIGGGKRGSSVPPVAKNTLVAALRLINHLHVRMHLFRHLGEVDWQRYHDSKPYEALPSCQTTSAATAERISFQDAGSLLAPEFCAGADQDGCACRLAECASRWKDRSGTGWERGPLPSPGLGMGLAANRAALGDDHLSWSMASYLQTVLSQTRYKPLCSAYGGVAKKKYPQDLSHIQSEHCGENSAPVFWVSRRGLATPLALCSSGLMSLAAGNMDINALSAAIGELFYGSALSDLAGLLGAASPKSPQAVALLQSANGNSAKHHDVSPLVKRFHLHASVRRLLLGFLPVKSGNSQMACGLVVVATERDKSTTQLWAISPSSLSPTCAAVTKSAATALIADLRPAFGALPDASVVNVFPNLPEACAGAALLIVAAHLREATSLADTLGKIPRELTPSRCKEVTSQVHEWARQSANQHFAKRSSYLDRMSSDLRRLGK